MQNKVESVFVFIIWKNIFNKNEENRENIYEID